MKISMKSAATILTGALSVSGAVFGATPHNAAAPKQVPAAVLNDSDQTIHAMQDEMDRSKARLAIRSWNRQPRTEPSLVVSGRLR